MIDPAAIRRATAADVCAIDDIYNHYVRTSTCTYQIEVEPLAERQAWFAEHDPARHPVTVAEHEGEIVGWAALSPFRSREGYRRTVEDSVYVRHDRQGRGIGRALLADLVRRARALGHHTVIAGIDAEQRGSVVLHERQGFVHAGRCREVGFKFDRWLDLVFLELLL